MRLWYLSHRQPGKAQASLRICTVSPEPLLFAHMKYGSRQRVRPKIRHIAPLDGCASRLKNEFTEDEKYHNLMRWLICKHVVAKGCLVLSSVNGRGRKNNAGHMQTIVNKVGIIAFFSKQKVNITSGSLWISLSDDSMISICLLYKTHLIFVLFSLI